MSDEVSRFVDVRTEERRIKIEDSTNGKSAFKHNQGVYTNVHIIIYLILTYNFSEFNLHILFYFFIFKPPCHLLIRRTNLLRSLVSARNVRPVAHLRFQTSLSKVILSHHLKEPLRPKPNQKNKIPVIFRPRSHDTGMT